MANDPKAAPATEHKALAFEFKAEGDAGTFTGYGAVTGNVDQGGDIIVPGAFAASLAKWSAKGKLPKLLWQHNTRQPIGIWQSMNEDSHGLFVQGKLTKGVQAADEAYALLKDGALDGLSIGYVPVADNYDSTTNIRKLTQVDLMECSLVTLPMNEMATVTAVKAADLAMLQKDWREIEAALRDEGLSRADAVKAVSGLKNYLRRDAGEPITAPRDEAVADQDALQLQELAARIRALAA